MAALIYSPVAIFLLILVATIVFVKWTDQFSFKSTNKDDAVSAGKSYACGEEFGGHLVSPDYSQFFPFAFFFTILHVVALMIATVPAQKGIFAAAAVYLAGAVLGLVVLFRKSS